MSLLRRAYIYLICAITLQTATWSAIALLREILAPSSTRAESIAMATAALVVTLPIFLVHWRWAERLRAADPAERDATLRWVYLYAMLAVFVGALANNAWGALVAALNQALGVRDLLGDPFPASLIRPLAALAVLAPLAAWHGRLLRTERPMGPAASKAATLRRLFLLGFSAAGVSATAAAAMELLQRSLPRLPGAAPEAPSAIPLGGADVSLSQAVAQLGVGLVLWLLAWRAAGRLVEGPDPAERASALRRFYLFALGFVPFIAILITSGLLLEGLFRRLLGLPAEGDAREPLAALAVLAIVWIYHARVRRDEIDRFGETPRQAVLRRIYDHLLALIGLTVFLVGLAGLASALLRLAWAAPGAVTAQQALLARMTAILILGLPLWALSWRRLQASATAPGAAGEAERGSFIRRLYLYLVLLGSGVTVIFAAIYLVYRVVSWLLGADPDADLGLDLAQALAYGLIAAAAWLAHFQLLRADGAAAGERRAAQLSSLSLVLVDSGRPELAALPDAIRAALPGLALTVLRVDTVQARASADAEAEPEPLAMPEPAAPPAPGAIASLAEIPADTGAILLPWDLLRAAPEALDLDPGLAGAIAASAALKILLPTRSPGWEWAGVEPWEADDLVEQAVHAVRAWSAGEAIEPARPLGPGALLGIALGLLLLLSLLSIPVQFFVARTFGP